MAAAYVAQHFSEKQNVTIESVQLGHWSFATGTFELNETDLVPPPLSGVSEDELDVNPHFINAVRVVTRRTRVAGNLPEPFFMKIVGGGPSEVMAEAVAYIGFAGRLLPHEVDQPIAICQQAIMVDGKYTCGVGRMLNSGQNAGHQTAGWTNFTQPCDTASASEINGLICGGEHGHNCACGTGNPVPINLSESLGTTNGTQTGSSYDSIRDNCWAGDTLLDEYDYNSLGPGHDGWPDKFWEITLPVIDCPGGAVGNCSKRSGAVTLQRSLDNPERQEPDGRGSQEDGGLAWNLANASRSDAAWSSRTVSARTRASDAGIRLWTGSSLKTSSTGRLPSMRTRPCTSARHASRRPDGHDRRAELRHPREDPSAGEPSH